MMKIVARSVALAVVFSLLFSGPLATFAVAQQPSQPELMQEEPQAGPEPSAAYDVGAGLANVFFVPGKAITCGAGVVVGFVLLALTFGSGYKAATAFGKEGCGGRWVLTGEDIRTAEWFGAGEPR